MSYTIKLLSVVRYDLRKAKKWYNDQKENLGDEFKIEVNKEFDYIKKHPEHYQIKYNGLRQALVNRFPYAIFYLIEKYKKRIIIFGVLHTSRNPELVKNRIE